MMAIHCPARTPPVRARHELLAQLPSHFAHIMPLATRRRFLSAVVARGSVVAAQNGEAVIEMMNRTVAP